MLHHVRNSVPGFPTAHTKPRQLRSRSLRPLSKLLPQDRPFPCRISNLKHQCRCHLPLHSPNIHHQQYQTRRMRPCQLRIRWDSSMLHHRTRRATPQMQCRKTSRHSLMRANRQPRCTKMIRSVSLHAIPAHHRPHLRALRLRRCLHHLRQAQASLYRLRLRHRLRHHQRFQGSRLHQYRRHRQRLLCHNKQQLIGREAKGFVRKLRLRATIISAGI